MDLGVPYTPVNVLPTELKGLAWRKRVITTFGHSEDQFLVLSPPEIAERSGHKVLGSGFNEAHAIASATIGLRHHSKIPSDEFEELRDFSFGVDLQAPGTILVHTCTNHDGSIVGRGDGKRAAAHDARFLLLSQRPASELSFEEFGFLAAAMEVRAGTGRRDKDKATLAVNSTAAIDSLLGRFYRHAPGTRKEGESLAGYILRMRSEIQDFKFGSSSMVYLDLKVQAEAGLLHGHVVLHASSVSPDLAVRLCHEREVEAARALNSAELAETANAGPVG
ncbi:MAG: hypothetical protein EPN79_10895 [Burkholderiaceae bacterium]|nr:MAG: hypothetical protein EPN79_10895 [Burkholderiaceae bacterium]TBR76808.1 MAG: hypothetical protein EPN64_06180 [Burkholderiaceae bacterium]